jgi:hypothetical protein
VSSNPARFADQAVVTETAKRFAAVDWVEATDIIQDVVLPLIDGLVLPHQRIAKRVGMGLGRLGSWAGNSSGDLFSAA